MHYRYSNLLRSAVIESFRSPWSLLSLPARQRVLVSIESRYCLLSDTSMMRELHESAMSSAMNIVGQSGVHAVHLAPLLLYILTGCSSDFLDGLQETASSFAQNVLS